MNGEEHHAQAEANLQAATETLERTGSLSLAGYYVSVAAVHAQLAQAATTLLWAAQGVTS